MEKKSKFRLRLNLFDGIVLVLALAAAAFLLWRMAKPGGTSWQKEAFWYDPRFEHHQ